MGGKMRHGVGATFAMLAVLLMMLIGSIGIAWQ